MYTTTLTMALATTVMISTASASVPAGWTFGGCMIEDHFEENITPRYVDTLDSSSMTIELCLATCTTTYAGIDGDVCYCGTTPFPALDRSLDYECNTPCPGDNSETCGGSIGFGWVSLYSKVAETSSSSAVIPTSTSVPTLSTSVPVLNATTSASVSYSTSTIYATSTATITSCAATVINCPLRTSTTVYAIGTTVVPCSTTGASTSVGTSTASASSLPVTSSSPTATYVASASMLTSTSTGSNATFASSTPAPTSVLTGNANVVGTWGSAALLMIVGAVALL